MAEFAASIPTFDTTPNVLLDPLAAQKAQALDLANQAARQSVTYTAAVQPAQINLLTNGLNALSGVGQPPGAPQAPAPQASPDQSSAPAAPAAQAPAVPASSIDARLGAGEGGSNPAAVNPQGYSGQFQFGTGRLTDLGLYQPAQGENPNGNTWQGSFSVPGFPQVKTYQQFLATPDAQRMAMHVQSDDIGKQIAATPGAGQYNPAGLTAVAHLGGVAGMQRFVSTGGAYDPADANGTRLSDYYNRYSQPGTPLGQDHGHPQGPFTTASGASPVPPAGSELQPVPQDDSARAAVKQLVAMRNVAAATPGGAGMRAVAGIQAQLDNIAGPGGIVDPATGNVYRVPGSYATRYAAAQATEAGKAGPAASLYATNKGVDVTAQNEIDTRKANLGVQAHTLNSNTDTSAAFDRPRDLAPGASLVVPGAVIPPQGAPTAPVAPALPLSPSSPTSAPAQPQQASAPAAPPDQGAPSSFTAPPPGQPGAFGGGYAPVQPPLNQLASLGSNIPAQPNALLGAAQPPAATPIAARTVAPAAPPQVPAPVAAPVAPPAPVAQPAAAPTPPGVYTAPLKPANPSDINAGFLKNDQEALGPIMDQGQQAQAAQIRTRAMRDNFAQNGSGAGAPTKLAVQDWLQSTFGDSVATNIMSKITNMPDVAAAQEAAKLALVNAGTQERGTLGSRGSLGAIQLYSAANPNISLQPDAIKRISNMQLVAQQADADYAQAANQHVDTQRTLFTQNTSGNYVPKSQFDAQWQAGRPAQVYAAAMGALNGDPFDKWQNNLTVPETQRVIGILTRADPGAPIQWKGGQTFHVPTGAAGG